MSKNTSQEKMSAQEEAGAQSKAGAQEEAGAQSLEAQAQVSAKQTQDSAVKAQSLASQSQSPANQAQSPAAQADSQVKAKEVARSTAMMSGLTLLSRITGFIRTWAMAFALGHTVLSAAFSLANNLPNMIYELVAGGVLSAAFLPIYLQLRNNKGDKKAQLYASNLLSITVVFLGVIALIASFFAPQVMVTQSMFSSASDATVQQATWFFRFFSFEIIFYGMSAVFGGLLNAHRQYFWPAVSSIFMNIVAIFSFFAYPILSSSSQTTANIVLATGTLLSIVIMAGVQVPALIKAGFKFKFYINFKGEGIRSTYHLALPAILCTAINLVSMSFMNSCALHVSDTGPASITYAWLWYQLPYGVLSVALSTALFTEMSHSSSKNDWPEFKKQLNFGLRTTCLLIIPMAAALFVCAPELIGLYSAGKFSSDDIAPVAQLLRGWAFTLPLYAVYMFLYRAFSAIKDLKTVALCNFILTFGQVAIYLICTGIITENISFGLVGIPIADTAFYLFMTVVLLVILYKRLGNLQIKNLFIHVCKVIAASLLAALIAFLLSRFLHSVFTFEGLLGSFVLLIIVGTTDVVFAIILCRIFQVKEISRIAARLKSKFLHKS